jgi:hypothetical protein
VHRKSLLVRHERDTAWVQAPCPETLGVQKISKQTNTVWDSRLGLEIKKSLGFKTWFGIQKKCLGLKTWSGDFVKTLSFGICALELIDLSSRTSFPKV